MQQGKEIVYGLEEIVHGARHPVPALRIKLVRTLDNLADMNF